MRGQVQILDVNPELAALKIEEKKTRLIEIANQACQSMVQRGGGVRDLRTKILRTHDQAGCLDGISQVSDMLIVEFQIDVCEAMGANIINTVAEFLAPNLVELVGGRVGLKILSNLCPERRCISYFEIPVSEMAWKSSSGKEVATKIMEAYLFAKLDIFRAATHNKGILNGIDAVAIATGQDWRAIESAAHAYPYFKHGTYHPLTQYSLIKRNDQEYFTGQLEIPIAVAAKGGVLESNPIYKNSFRMLGFPGARELAEIITSVGLSQNFAALRALAIEGIQKGHMNLHARNIAISVGIPHRLVSDAVEFMKSRGKISKESAHAYLEAIELFSELRASKTSQNEERDLKQLSTFYLEIPFANLKEPIIINLALDCMSKEPIHLTMFKENIIRGQDAKGMNSKNDADMIQLRNSLFGHKDYDWLISFISELEMLRFNSDVNILMNSGLTRSIELSYKLKVIAILVNLVTFNMITINFQKTRDVLNIAREQFRGGKTAEINKVIEGEDVSVRYGLSLLSELIKVFYYNTDQILLLDGLKDALNKELYNIIDSALTTYLIWEKANTAGHFNFEDFLMQRKKRMSATLMLLCDGILLKSGETTPQMLEYTYLLGDIFEMEGTMMRDLSKWSFSKPVENNTFTYWLMLKGKFMGGDQISVQNEFKKDVMNIVDPLKAQLFEKYGDAAKKFYTVTREIINNHYNSKKAAKL